jgi:hypothetical protein
MHQVSYLQRLYQDAQSTEHEIHNQAGIHVVRQRQLELKKYIKTRCNNIQRQSHKEK